MTDAMKPGTMSVTLIVSLMLLLPVFWAPDVEARSYSSFDPSNTRLCSMRYGLMDPIHEKRYGVDVVWQIPPSPKAVLFLAHGGEMDPFGYFDRGPQCKHCNGLPEQRTVVLEALRRRYAVISVKSIGERYDTYWPLEESEDLVIVTNVIKEWTSEHALDGLPLAVWGHSAGSGIASALSMRLPLRALVLMCAGGLREVEVRATPLQFPPTFFAYMPVDWNNPTLNSTGHDAEVMAILTERGVEVAEAQCWPKPLYPLFFTERIVCMSDELSAKVFAAFQAAGWVDRKGYLKINPSQADWKAVLLKANALPFCSASGDLCFGPHVEQELKMAFAEHSFTSDADDSIFPWLDATIFPSSSGPLIGSS